MRTIDKLLEYNLTELEEIKLFQCQIINGIGGEDQNLEKMIYEMVKVVEWWDDTKATSFLDDVRKISMEHDCQYRFRMGFYWSNFKFARKFYHLMHWNKKRLAIAIGVYILLNKLWKKFYFKNK